MNLQPISRQPALSAVLCISCGTKAQASDAFADLDGEPFRAYHCFTCAAGLLPPGEAANRIFARDTA